MVYIIVLNWNGWKDTLECLESCQKLTYPRFRMVVVDNDSSDDSTTQIRARFMDLPLIETSENLGFAGGNNAGIQYALEQGAECVWLLNNDTVVAPDTLTELMALLQSDARVGIAGSKVYYYDEPRPLNCAGGRISRFTGYPFNIGRHETDRGQFDARQDVDYILGCSFLIRASAIRATGLMDDRFFLYFEDADWSYRARRQGWRVVLAPKSLVWHKESRSVGLHSPRMIYYFARNSLLFAQKAMPWVLPLTLVRTLQLFVIKRMIEGDFNKARLGWLGIADFFRRRFGRSTYV
ncbi:MAG: glycosyltransferase family 2 protein [Acidobacteria bacterium]|nr:glycosyltransferase family 2 protein [Acidobacteriota bacterium]